jgi:hypothetical protein
MDISRAFRAVFDDPAWPGKLLLAFVFEILIVTFPAVIGYFAQYIRNVAEGRDVPLPEWNAFGTYWVRGLLIFLVGILYIFVGLLLFGIGVIPAVITLQAVVVEYAMTWEGRYLFAMRTAWRHIVGYPQYWIALLISFALGVAVSVVTSPFSGARSAAAAAVGGLISAILGLYVSLVSQHLYGQYARLSHGFAAPPSPAQPTTGGYAPPPPPPQPPSGGFPAPGH